jgi:hypothetical protein
VALLLVSLEYLVFTCQSSFHQLFSVHYPIIGGNHPIIGGNHPIIGGSVVPMLAASLNKQVSLMR